ncbi:TetR family transcriptional regulator [Gluconacetobacter sp. 1c LMG 22058]|uniref:TetR family transcriptional regulator n=2 Tax=Gluconacetobacter dulcium TaxID=2729096 RepID=A0A7W4PGX3_9PROT|nr:TetR family transcriptional regulator [Gluconacetobacter dulcium]
MNGIKQPSCVNGDSEQAPPDIRRRRGGRSARVHAAVIEATLSMMEAGETPRVEEVARRAGVQKTSIYRRWGTLESLVFEAVDARTRMALPLPDTGSCHEDLKIYLAASIAFHRSDFGKLVTRLGVQIPEDARREFWRKRLEAASVLLSRGQSRGEVAPDLNVGLAIEMLIAPFYFRALVSGEEISPSLTEALLNIALPAFLRRPE